MSLFPLGLISQGGGAGGGAGFELISTTILSTTASSVTFSGIPSSFKHLQIRFALTTSAVGYAGKLQLNGDTTNYNAHILSGWVSGGTPTYASSGAFSDLYCHSINTGSGGSSEPTVGIIDILDYANTNKYKTTRTLAGVAGASQKEITMFSGAWRSTSAITSATIAVVGATTYASGSRFSLYGVRGE